MEPVKSLLKKQMSQVITSETKLSDVFGPMVQSLAFSAQFFNFDISLDNGQTWKTGLDGIVGWAPTNNELDISKVRVRPAENNPEARIEMTATVKEQQQ